jgi:hypothetical protein
MPFHPLQANAADYGADRISCTPTKPAITLAAAGLVCAVRSSPRIARRGTETSQKLGCHRWVIERSFALFNKFRRLTIRYERRIDIHHAFTSFG